IRRWFWGWGGSKLMAKSGSNLLAIDIRKLSWFDFSAACWNGIAKPRWFGFALLGDGLDKAM
ncbi:hypothetical protein, partial [Ferrovum sp.]|uniref:hypothetical protein n=1 Tax=Ferrovum sp. TaxID=2609467 RepID=UPI002610839B